MGDPFRVVLQLALLSGGTAHPRLLRGDRIAVLLVVLLQIIIKFFSVLKRNTFVPFNFLFNFPFNFLFNSQFNFPYNFPC